MYTKCMQQWPQAISKRSESVGDSNFPDKCSDLSDGQIGTSGQGVRFTGMFPHAGMTIKAQRLAD
ncbi:hypothetical protein [Paraglaciecola chathamensis]|uniref:hypothetical protein n=1 Tax=Paraglaciecola chathamensis TaxID=368405 RepID=UPI001E3BDE3C|nr:hypothetical protein [Paraglaciecola oceanifecundans]